MPARKLRRLSSSRLAPGSAVVLTCEHASHEVPRSCQELFLQEKWQEHQIYDLGAAHLAEHLAHGFHLPLIKGEVSRLVVDLNRSLSHPKLSALWGQREEGERAQMIATYYEPFRTKVLEMLKASLPVVHIGVHSFTRALGNEVRSADIGILYDPKSREEKRLAGEWIVRLKAQGFRTRANYPYLGTSDGHTTALRQIFGYEAYAGLELEVCNDLLTEAKREETLRRIVAAGLPTGFGR